MTRQIDWNGKAEYATTLSIESLYYAMKDCIEAAQAAHGMENEGYYHDEASIYRAELIKRGKQV